MKTHLNYQYSKKEEFLNILTHGIGLVLSIIALPILIVRALEINDSFAVFSFTVFGISMILLYAASTFYHAAKKPKIRRRLNIFDHAAIYVLIAGSYTPFTLITLKGWLGWVLFGLTWIFALIGIVLKLFYTGKFDKLSTVMYVLMGWQIVFAIKPLLRNLSSEGVTLLIAGGVSYTIGAVLYSIKKLPFNHAIFHVFVLAGTFCHFLSVLWYVV